VGCHNTDLALAHLDCAVQNALRDTLPHYLFPSHPAVAEYLVTMAADIADQWRPAVMELDAFEYPGAFEHGAHHEMNGVPLGRFHSGLLALCFCPSCRLTVVAPSVDPIPLRAAVRQ